MVEIKLKYGCNSSLIVHFAFFICFLLPLWEIEKSTAQQLPLYTQYFLNDYAVNPAVTGTKNGFELKSDYRYQWAGITDAPRTYVLSIHGPWKDKNMGVGGYVFSDVTGPTARLGLNLSYAYHINITDSLKLSFGLFGGAMQYNLDGSKIFLIDDDDPALSNSIETRLLPDASFGVYTFSPRFYAGLTAQQLLQNKVEFSGDNTDAISRLKTHFYAMAGYKLPIGSDFDIEPNLLLKMVSPVPLQIDACLKFAYKKMIWLGGLLRTSDNALSFMAGYTHSNKLIFGYAYETTTSNIKNYSSGTHEIMLGIVFPGMRTKKPEESTMYGEEY